MEFRFVFFVSLLFSLLSLASCTTAQKSAKGPAYEIVESAAAWKKLHKQRTSVLTLFVPETLAEIPVGSKNKQIVDAFAEAAAELRNKRAFAVVQCGLEKDLRALCKRWKCDMENVQVKWFQNGELTKDYDWPLLKASMVAFMEDPNGEPPFKDMPSAQVVDHLTDKSFANYISSKKSSFVSV